MRSPNVLRIRKKGGFTLVELLVVITIIVILTGLTLGAMGWVTRMAANKKARAQLAKLENGLERYHADTGTYPGGDGLKGSGLAVYQALFGDGVGDDGVLADSEIGSVSGTPEEGAKVYLPDLDPSSDPTQMVDGSATIPTGLLDPFGGQWYYRSGALANGEANNPDFDLFSYGADGKTGGDYEADDIHNW